MVITKEKPSVVGTEKTGKGVKAHCCKKSLFTKQDSKRGRKEQRIYKTENSTMAMVSLYPSIITFSIIGLNSFIKRHRITEWIKKQDPIIC